MNVSIPFCFLEFVEQAEHACFECALVNRFFTIEKNEKMPRKLWGFYGINSFFYVEMHLDVRMFY